MTPVQLRSAVLEPGRLCISRNGENRVQLLGIQVGYVCLTHGHRIRVSASGACEFMQKLEL
jgi:hypothetical protein